MPDQSFIASSSGSAMPHAGTYRRVLPVSLERLYENALDWEHLPHVHASSFTDVRCLEAGPRGWRVSVTTAGGLPLVLELTLDRMCRRWITRTLDGAGAGTEIWTHAFPVGPHRVDVVVDFFVPGLAGEEQVRMGEGYARHYARLYDEDVAMMRERQRQLDARLDRAREADRRITLGPRSALELPLHLTLGGRSFVLAEAEGRLLAFPARCPHLLGPLHAGALEGRVVTCPWHGDSFDVITGENLSGRACSLSHLPEVCVAADGSVHVMATH